MKLKTMKKILFVCLGNICRSPMAKFIFIDLLKQNRLENKFIVDSAATSASEVGNELYYKAKQKLEEKGIECIGHIARQLKKEDYENYDYIIAMEDKNIYNILNIIGKDSKNKVAKLLDYSERQSNIADPWYTGDFEKAYNDIYVGCVDFLKYLMENVFKDCL